MKNRYGIATYGADQFEVQDLVKGRKLTVCDTYRQAEKLIEAREGWEKRGPGVYVSIEGTYRVCRVYGGQWLLDYADEWTHGLGFFDTMREAMDAAMSYPHSGQFMGLESPREEATSGAK